MSETTEAITSLMDVVKAVPPVNGPPLDEIQLAWRLGSLQAVVLDVLTQALRASQLGETDIPISGVLSAIDKYAARVIAP
ncbi:hypothetical protein ACWDT6_30065 [Nocardia grenadensis]|uniref:hypothetical protein n=1 Tax=Embleya sp. NPDC005971 TaxID=3156724 RepID=UPI0033C22A0D